MNDAGSGMSAKEKPAAMETPPSPEVLTKALRKVLAAIEGTGFKAAAVGEIGHQAWGSKRAARRIELVISSAADQRETVLGAARGEGLQPAPGGQPLNIQYTDAKVGGTAAVDLIEAATPYLKQVLARAQPGSVLQVNTRVATCEDLILLRAGSTVPADIESVVELLRGTAGKIDGAYLKKEAEAAGVFDRLKATWQLAKQQG
jgi:hypothetical protein